MKSNQEPEFVLDRTFEAPQEQVFEAYSNARHLCNWWGSTPFDLVICELDFQPNGRFFYGLSSSDFKIHGVFDYLEIEEPGMIRYINYFADKDGFPIRHPMSKTWPIRMMNVITFTAKEEKTELQIVTTAYQANEIELKTFKEGLDALEAGFKGTFDKLEEYLKTMD